MIVRTQKERRRDHIKESAVISMQKRWQPLAPQNQGSRDHTKKWAAEFTHERAARIMRAAEITSIMRRQLYHIRETAAVTTNKNESADEYVGTQNRPQPISQKIRQP